MTFEEYTFGSYSVVKIIGDTSNPEELEKVRDYLFSLCRSGKHRIAVDFIEADYVGSGIINTLVKLMNMLKEHNGLLAIIAGQQKILDVFQIVNLEKIIPIYLSFDDFNTKA